MGSAPFWGQVIRPGSPPWVVDSDGLHASDLWVKWMPIHDQMSVAILPSSNAPTFEGVVLTPLPTSNSGSQKQLMPGKVVVRGAKAHRVDKKSPAGKSGGTLTHLGREIPEYHITLTMWRQKQWELWQDLVKKLMPENDETPPPPVNVYHIYLNSIGVSQMYPLEIGLPEHQPGAHWEFVDVRMRWIKYFPPPQQSATNTPTQKKISGNATQDPSLPHNSQSGVSSTPKPR